MLVSNVWAWIFPINKNLRFPWFFFNHDKVFCFNSHISPLIGGARSTFIEGMHSLEMWAKLIQFLFQSYPSNKLILCEACSSPRLHFTSWLVSQLVSLKTLTQIWYSDFLREAMMNQCNKHGLHDNGFAMVFLPNLGSSSGSMNCCKIFRDFQVANYLLIVLILKKTSHLALCIVTSRGLVTWEAESLLLSKPSLTEQVVPVIDIVPNDCLETEWSELRLWALTFKNWILLHWRWQWILAIAQSKIWRHDHMYRGNYPNWPP